MGFVIVLLFKQPKELNVEVPGKGSINKTDKIKIYFLIIKKKTVIKESNSVTPKEQKDMTMRDLWKIPMVAEVAVTVFCLKVVRYCMYMWLPMYLLQQLKYSKTNAGMFSTMFEIGLKKKNKKKTM